MVHIAEPNTRLTGLLNSPGEALHYFVPVSFAERLDVVCEAPSLVLCKTLFKLDRTLGFLSQELADSLAGTSDVERMYTDNLCSAVVARLFCHFSNRPTQGTAAKGGLSAWRMKRVQEYVQAHLDQRILLSDLASVAGLSSMHFASQFRRTCGLGPHEYLIQQRVERAKGMLGFAMPILRLRFIPGLLRRRTFPTSSSASPDSRPLSGEVCSPNSVKDNVRSRGL